MAERVDLPADSRPRAVAELVLKKSQSERHLVDHVGVVGGRLVVHAPAAVDEFEAALGDELADEGFGGVGLFVPPAPKEGHFDVDESTARVVG